MSNLRAVSEKCQTHGLLAKKVRPTGLQWKISDPWVTQKLVMTCEVLLSENVTSDLWAVAPEEGVRLMGHGHSKCLREVGNKTSKFCFFEKPIHSSAKGCARPEMTTLIERLTKVPFWNTVGSWNVSQTVFELNAKTFGHWWALQIAKVRASETGNNVPVRYNDLDFPLLLNTCQLSILIRWEIIEGL
jgi:hypothetical protein